ncbi:hypothetical protein [Sphingobium sp. B12D2B]|uniref:hypothetical protein n=1 Tax=Sphingobium sp. B12D2B TaxID=2940577 RepID=UPI0022258D59|nr:hypothetical protein [Sphingobium sp. B12D2B]MCW2351530.1 hypothetical protein [Sphingobium sp. B12D2B]
MNRFLFRRAWLVTLSGSFASAALAQPPFEGAAPPVDVATLEQVTGRADLNQIAQSEHVAAVSDSSVSGNSVTGAVAIDGNAFQNLSGLAIINANSGNNVAINASMNVNIALLPAQ